MNTYAIVILAVLVIAIALIGLMKLRGGSQAATVNTPRLTLEEKLAALEECGFKLAEPFTVEDLLFSWPREEYEELGFYTILHALGSDEEKEPWRYRCDNLWTLDTECIEDHGSYREIALRAAEITGGSLKFDNVRDHVDIEGDEAWFSFDFDGREIRVDCKVNDDWLDTDIFHRFIELLAEADPSKQYVFFNTGDQTCIIGCVTREQLRLLNQRGIGFIPLADAL